MIRLFVFIVLITHSISARSDDLIELEYAPSPVANPLKGLVPYASGTNVHFPHSMEFSYVGFAELMKGYDEFDWRPMENLLDGIAGRGHQAVWMHTNQRSR